VGMICIMRGKDPSDIGGEEGQLHPAIQQAVAH
jgi:hypothetical protein